MNSAAAEIFLGSWAGQQLAGGQPRGWLRQRQHHRVDERTTMEDGLIQPCLPLPCRARPPHRAATMRWMALTHLVVLMRLTRGRDSLYP